MVAGLFALLPARACNAQSNDTSTTDQASVPATQRAELSARLTARNATQADRDEAASRLAALNTPVANAALLAVLNSGTHDAQLAVARAQALSAQPDPAFIDPLAARLGGDRSLDEAAARALSRLGSFPAAAQRLLNFARDNRQPPGLRAIVIRACSAIVEKSVAGALVDLLNDENTTIQNAAADALADLTGMTNIGRELAAWKKWYTANAGKTDDAWKLLVYPQRDARLDEIAQRHIRLLDELDQVLTQEFQSAPDKNATVMRYLTSPDPEVRAIGAHLVGDSFLNGLAAPTEAQKQRLSELVSDSDAHVRLQAARTLKAINFSGAIDAMMAQLPLETDPEVKAALVAAIAQIGDIRAVPLLRKLLSDPSLSVQRAAVDALRTLGPAYYKADRDGAHDLALQLWNLYQQRAKDSGTGDLQAACIEAIAPLRESSLVLPLVRLLDPDQSDPMRAAVLRALGDLGDPNTDDAIRTWLLQETQPTIRLDALDALGKAGSFGADAEALYSFFKPDTTEPEPAVRERAWQVFQALLPTASKEMLNAWAGSQLLKEPNHRLGVLLELNRKLTADRSLEDLALQQQNTGDTYLKLEPPQYDQAAKYFQSALAYWQGQNVSNEVTENLVTQLMNSLLKSQQYADAARFAEKMISSSRSQQQTMGSLILEEAERLQNSTDAASSSADHANALNLIDQAMKMKPPLDGSYLDDLRGIQKQLRQKLPQQ
jgi:HEAT repeat protein